MRLRNDRGVLFLLFLCSISAAIITAARATSSARTNMIPGARAVGAALTKPDVEGVVAYLRREADRFGVPAQFTIGGRAVSSLRAADFDGDGKVDLAMTRSPSTSAAILFGDGAGNFSAPARFALDAAQETVAVADFNGDGAADRAVSGNFTTEIAILLANASEIAAEGARSATAFAADLNGDGRTDLAVARPDSPDSKEVSIYLHGENSPMRVDAGSVPGAFGAEDFNQDGSLDLAIAGMEDGRITIFAGDGRGGFNRRRRVEAGHRVASLAIADFNGDQVMDLAAASDDSRTVSFFLGVGQSGFHGPNTFTIPDAFLTESALESSGEKGMDGGRLSFLSQFALLAAPVPSLTLSPNTISGGSGAPATGSITLSEPAPAGGIVVALASSNSALAAPPQSVTVPEGQTTAAFVVATNPSYRRYSGLSFQATITASANGTSASSLLTLTAQARPANIANDSTFREGTVCGGSIPARAGEKGILYRCTRGATPGTAGACSFVAECALGCQSQPSSDGRKYGDVCAASGPFPITLTPAIVPGGAASLAAAQMAPVNSFGASVVVNSSQPFAIGPTAPLPVAAGGTLLNFNISTGVVPTPSFAAIGIDIKTSQTSGSSVFELHRLATTWLTALPGGTPAPPPALASFNILTNPVTGGANTNAAIILATPAPPGGAQALLNSNNPVAAIPASVTIQSGQTTGFILIRTQTVAAAATATLTASSGGVSQSATLTINPGTSCVPTTCAAQGRNCGTISDGCGGTIVCGSCGSPETCGGSGIPNVCGLAPQSHQLAVTASGRAGERITSTPTGINVSVGGTGSATFSSGASITLSVSNGRNAVWSGACDSGGQRQRTCAFALTSNSTVTANIQ